MGERSRRAHNLKPCVPMKRHPSTMFVVSLLTPLRAEISPCEIFPTSPATIFLEKKSVVRIIQVEIETRNKQNKGGGAGCRTK